MIAGRGQAGYHSRHDHVLEHVQVGLLPHERTQPARRQPAQGDGEQEDEDEAEPVSRHAEREHRDEEDQPVGHGVLLDRGDDPRPDPDDDGEQARRPGQQHGDPELLHHQGQHGTALLDGDPPISLQDVPEPSEILHVGGIVEAVFLAQGLSRLGRGEDAHQDVDGVSGSKLDEGEYDGRRAEEHRYQEEEPPSQEPEHFAVGPAWSHRRSARQGSLPRINAASALARRPPPGVRPLMPEPLGPGARSERPPDPRDRERRRPAIHAARLNRSILRRATRTRETGATPWREASRVPASSKPSAAIRARAECCRCRQ